MESILSGLKWLVGVDSFRCRHSKECPAPCVKTLPAFGLGAFSQSFITTVCVMIMLEYFSTDVKERRLRRPIPLPPFVRRDTARLPAG